MANLAMNQFLSTLLTFDHETRVEGSETDLEHYGFLVNRHETEAVFNVQTFGGEFVRVKLQPNEIYPVKLRKFISWDAEGTTSILIAILWNTEDPKVKPIDPPVQKKSTDAAVRDKHGNVLSVGISGRGY